MLNIKNTTDGYLKDVEIKGNTIQDIEQKGDLADIRSVGDKIEGQELYKIDVVSRGKNLFDGKLELGLYEGNNAGAILNKTNSNNNVRNVNPIPLKGGKTYTFLSSTKDGDFRYWITDKNNIVLTSVTGGVISNNFGIAFTFETTQDSYFYYRHRGTDINAYVSIEEGTQATLYEPYQEDKLTILSPVQLEKVGDVRDRIVCKDGVWGVEKNVETIVLNNTNSYVIDSANSTGDTLKINFTFDNRVFEKNEPLICNKLQNINSDTGAEHIRVATSSIVVVRIHKSKLTTLDKAGVDEYLKNNQYSFKIKSSSQAYYDLPHDQQVKLRTFAGQTNIHFETEIEPTLKAQVPKSLGATVNTHTEQIGNLSKELDRVKKLEESTVSTVTTESDFTTVEATSNGYFEDVKLEGKTLVSKYSAKTITTNIGTLYNHVFAIPFKVEIGKAYTIVGNVKSPTKNAFDLKYKDSNTYITSLKNTFVYTFTATHNETLSLVSLETGEYVITDLMFLEGDHTQNPPEYFEGLMSVGQDVEEVSVESVNENLFDGEFESGTFNDNTGNITIQNNRARNKNKFIRVNKDTLYGKTNSLFLIGDIYCYDINKKYLGFVGFNMVEGSVLLKANTSYINFNFKANNLSDRFTIDEIPSNVVISLNDSNSTHKQDKKRILYYNPETQTWEKPILRQWDSIEKHSDGKYYYHKRSGEVVLNGSENWNSMTLTSSGLEDYLGFGTPIENGKTTDAHANYVIDTHGFANLELNTINNNGFLGEALTIHGDGNLYIRILKSRISSQNVEGFKEWLQANNVTIVYQLAQEEVYECTNIDLITYANETNYTVSSGAIAPKSILKVHNNISNVVKILQEKVNLLESNVIASQEVQDMMILESDLRILDIELALMEHMPIKLNLGENIMLRSATYFNFIKGHIVNETYSKDYLENVMNKYLATNRLTQEEYDELYKLLYPQNYDIALPIEE